MDSSLPPETKTAMKTAAFTSRRKRPKRIYKLAAIVILLVVGVIVGNKHFSPKPTAPTSQTLGKVHQQIDLDHHLQIPIETQDGEETEQFVNFELTSAELTDEIILKGQKATAVNDRVFLIINIKLSNPTENSLKVDTRNYLRLSVNDSPDRLAPNVHNDPVEVQPISDQPGRLGFSINKADANHLLFLGEIKGKKTEIPLNFN